MSDVATDLPIALTTDAIPAAELAADRLSTVPLRPYSPDDGSAWMTQAVCGKEDPDLFFPRGDTDTRTIEKAIGLCQGCPVKLACRFRRYDLGATGVVMGGVYYGANVQGYRPCGRAGCTRPAVSAQNGYCGYACEHAAKVGTMSGYRLHVKARTGVCPPCREARHADGLKYGNPDRVAKGAGRAVVTKPNDGRVRAAV